MATTSQLAWTALRENLGYGARANKYLLQLTAPTGGEVPVAGQSSVNYKDDEIIALCKGASVPDRTMGVAEVWIQGRKIPIPGDAQFAGEFTLTFWNDQTHKLRKNFEVWIENLDSYNQHKRGYTAQQYYTDKMKLSQLDAKDQTKICATWEFFHVFPTNISAVEFGADQQDQVSEFSVQFVFAHYNRTL